MRQRARAFTLIELLVVISIIAMLIAMLMPLLGSMRRSAQFMQCIANMHQFSIASHSYLREHDNYVVHPNWGESSKGWLYTAGRPGSLSYDQRVKLRESGYLWTYMGREGSMYHCPADEGPFETSNFSFPTPVRAMTSYQFNGGINNFGGLGTNTYAIDELTPNGIFMWETDATTSRVTGGFWNDGGNHPGEGLEIRHLDGAPVGILDGSAKKITQKEFYAYRDEPASQRPNEIWINPR